ncbi:MAG: hypothetical protein M3R24_28045 [Chloroflexota bacterium]|nr:hypothetical protein [Chloroflexota bacterium]
MTQLAHIEPLIQPAPPEICEAGPALDVLIATDVLLLDVCDPEAARPVYHASPAWTRCKVHQRAYRNVPAFSRSEVAVALVLRRLHASFCDVATEMLPDGHTRCIITPPASYGHGPVVRLAATRPLAICLAALAVMRRGA